MDIHKVFGIYKGTSGEGRESSLPYGMSSDQYDVLRHHFRALWPHQDDLNHESDNARDALTDFTRRVGQWYARGLYGRVHRIPDEHLDVENMPDNFDLYYYSAPNEWHTGKEFGAGKPGEAHPTVPSLGGTPSRGHGKMQFDNHVYGSHPEFEAYPRGYDSSSKYNPSSDPDKFGVEQAVDDPRSGLPFRPLKHIVRNMGELAAYHQHGFDPANWPDDILKTHTPNRTPDEVTNVERYPGEHTAPPPPDDFDTDWWDSQMNKMLWKMFGINKANNEEFKFDSAGEQIGGPVDETNPQWDAHAQASGNHSFAMDQGWTGVLPNEDEFHPETGEYGGVGNTAHHVKQWANDLQTKHNIPLVNHLGEPVDAVYDHHGFDEEPINHTHITDYIKAKTGKTEAFPGAVKGEQFDIGESDEPFEFSLDKMLWKAFGIFKRDADEGEEHHIYLGDRWNTRLPTNIFQGSKKEGDDRTHVNLTLRSAMLKAIQHLKRQDRLQEKFVRIFSPNGAENNLLLDKDGEGVLTHSIHGENENYAGGDAWWENGHLEWEDRIAKVNEVRDSMAEQRMNHMAKNAFPHKIYADYYGHGNRGGWQSSYAGEPRSLDVEEVDPSFEFPDEDEGWGNEPEPYAPPPITKMLWKAFGIRKIDYNFRRPSNDSYSVATNYGAFKNHFKTPRKAMRFAIKHARNGSTHHAHILHPQGGINRVSLHPVTGNLTLHHVTHSDDENKILNRGEAGVRTMVKKDLRQRDTMALDRMKLLHQNSILSLGDETMDINTEALYDLPQNLHTTASSQGDLGIKIPDIPEIGKMLWKAFGIYKEEWQHPYLRPDYDWKQPDTNMHTYHAVTQREGRAVPNDPEYYRRLRREAEQHVDMARMVSEVEGRKGIRYQPAPDPDDEGDPRYPTSPLPADIDPHHLEILDRMNHNSRREMKSTPTQARRMNTKWDNVYQGKGLASMLFPRETFLQGDVYGRDTIKQMYPEHFEEGTEDVTKMLWKAFGLNKVQEGEPFKAKWGEPQDVGEMQREHKMKFDALNATEKRVARITQT